MAPSRPTTIADGRARRRSRRVARRTPVLSTRTFSERAGGTVALKAENLQRTGSFKVRGVAAKLAALGRGGLRARRRRPRRPATTPRRSPPRRAARGVPCEVFVPADAPIAKVEAARGQGAIVHLGGDSRRRVPRRRARARARAAGSRSCTRSTTRTIVAGQGSLGLELLEDVPDLAQVVVPVGGGGLCAGIAIAVKAARPEVEVVGVQVAACAPYPESLRARRAGARPTSALTIADGIAVKRPGELTLRAARRVARRARRGGGEDETAEAMVLLMERCKLVVEGAGAVGVAALLGGQVAPPRARHDGRGAVRRQRRRRACSPPIARRHETEAGRRLVLLTRVPDRPGGARAPARAASPSTGANIVDVSHVREGLDLHVRETAVELVLETRGHEHAERGARRAARRRLRARRSLH